MSMWNIIYKDIFSPGSVSSRICAELEMSTSLLSMLMCVCVCVCVCARVRACVYVKTENLGNIFSINLNLTFLEIL